MKRFWLAIVIGWLLTLPANAAGSGDFGKFLDPLNVTLSNEGDGRIIVLMNDYRFQDPSGKIWTSKSGWKVDGASIPRPLWALVGGPLEGLYRNASVIHDYYCDTKEDDWKETHRVFYYAMRANSVSAIRAAAMYYAVYAFGPRWTSRVVNRLSQDCDTTGCYRNLVVVQFLSTETIADVERSVEALKVFNSELEGGKEFSLAEIEERADQDRGKTVTEVETKQKTIREKWPPP